jgi:tetratricopeptide (TPR) repeat protein
VENDSGAKVAQVLIPFALLCVFVTVMGDFSPIISFAALGALVLAFVARWASPRFAKMRELEEQTRGIQDQRASFFARFLAAHRALGEDEQRFLAVEAYAAGLSEYAKRVVFPQGPPGQTETDVDDAAVLQYQRNGGLYQFPPELLTEIPGLEKAALKSAHVDWDYPLRSEPDAEKRRVLGYATFLAAWLALLLASIFLPHTLGVPYIWNLGTQPYAGPAAGFTILTGLSFALAWKVGAWHGINPYDHGYALYTSGKLKRAARHLERAVARHPESLRAGYALASLLVDTGRLDEAADRASRLLLTYPDSALALELKARIESNLGSQSAAAEEYRRAAAAAEAAWALTFADRMRRMADASSLAES